MTLRGPKRAVWPNGEYTSGVVIRILLLFVLWIFYGMIPHQLGVSALWIVTAILVAYAVLNFSKGPALMGWLMLIAAALNTLLFAVRSDVNWVLNMVVILCIFALLLFDVVLAK
jgi:hypothetical protein